MRWDRCGASVETWWFTPPNRESGLKLMLFTCWKSKRKGGSIPPLHTTSLQSAGRGAGRLTIKSERSTRIHFLLSPLGPPGPSHVYPAQTARTCIYGHLEEHHVNDPAVSHLEMDDNVPGREHEYGRPRHAMSVMPALAFCRGHQKVCSYDYGKEASSLGSTLWGACPGSVSTPRRSPVRSYFIAFGAIAPLRVTAPHRVCTRDGVAGTRNC